MNSDTSSSKCTDLTSAPRRDLRARQARLRGWLRWVAGYGTLAGIAALALLCGTISNADDSIAEAAKLTRRCDELDRTISILRPQLSETQDRLIVAHTIGDQPDWSELLSIIASQVNNGVILTSIHLEPTNDVPAGRQPKPTNAAAAAKGDERDTAVPLRLTLQGAAPGLGVVSQFVLRLEKLNLFERIDQQSNGRGAAAAAGETVTFRLDCPLHRGPIAAASSESKTEVVR